MHLYRVKYTKCLRTRKYNSEQKCEWNLSDYSWQLSHFIWIILTVWFWRTHSEYWQHSQSVLLSLAVGQIEHLPSHLLPLFFTVKWKLVVCKGHTLLSCPSEYVVISTLSCELTIFFSQRKLIQTSSMILLFLPIRICQRPQYKYIYANITQAEEVFSDTSALLISYNCILSQPCPEYHSHF